MSPIPPLKQGKNPEGRSYEYDRERLRRQCQEARTWAKDYYGDTCQDCGGVKDPEWHQPRGNGKDDDHLTLYHQSMDYGAHVAFINRYHPGSPKRPDQCWGVNLFRWLKARWNGGTDFRPSFILVCGDCKKRRGAG